MTSRNTLSKGQYLRDHLFWGAVSMVWFNSLLFRSIEGWTYRRSRLFLWAALLLFAAAGIAAAWKRQRNNFSLFIHLLLPYCVYAFAAFRRTAPGLGWGLAALSALLLAADAALLVPAKRKTAAARAGGGARRKALEGARAAAACGLSALLIVLAAGAVLSVFPFSPSVTPVRRSDGEAATIAGHIETLALLEEEPWRALSTQEKLDVLQTAANIEAYYLGLPHELNVIAGMLPESTLGSYNDRTHVITLNIDHLENDFAHEVLDSLCHEARHSYQRRLCDLYDSASESQKALLLFSEEDIRAYKQEFSDYTSGKEDPQGYYSQRCETDAREYASACVADYYSKIRAYRQGAA